MFPFKIEDIAKATTNRPQDYTKVLGHLKNNWPLLVAAAGPMATNRQAVVGFAATIAVECHFVPIREIVTPEYCQRMYGRRKDFVVDANGLWIWRGRGFIQLTGADNYAKADKVLKLGIVANPDKALEPATAAKIAVWYFTSHGCDVWSSRGHWLMVRELVNGTGNRPKRPNGWEKFDEYVYKLLSVAYA